MHGALIDCRLDLIGGAADSGFGTLLFDPYGRLIADPNRRTWLFSTTRTAGGEWFSQARRLDLDNWVPGTPVTVLEPRPGELRAVIHLVIALSADCYLALYSNGRGVGAAWARRPDGPYRTQESFSVDPQDGWELNGGPREAASLEANGALVFENEGPDWLTLWVGYDSYHPGVLCGELGWLKLAIDKTGAEIREWSRYPDNPLPFLADGETCARCGGNLDSALRFGGRHAFFYYARRNTEHIEIKLALSRDPLFREPDWIGHFDGPLGDEEVIEKFQAFAMDGLLYLIYESRNDSGHWRTGLRRYSCDRLRTHFAEMLGC